MSNFACKLQFVFETLAALDQVPRWSRETVNTVMSFYAAFAEMIGNLSYSNLKLANALEERKRAEEALQDSEARYRAIVEAFDGLIYVCSQDYRVEFMNERFIERTGYNGTGEL